MAELSLVIGPEKALLLHHREGSRTDHCCRQRAERRRRVSTAEDAVKCTRRMARTSLFHVAVLVLTSVAQVMVAAH